MTEDQDIAIALSPAQVEQVIRSAGSNEKRNCVEPIDRGARQRALG